MTNSEQWNSIQRDVQSLPCLCAVFNSKRLFSRLGILFAVTTLFACSPTSAGNVEPDRRAVVPTFTNTSTFTPVATSTLTSTTVQPIELAAPPPIGTEVPLADPGEIPDLFVTETATGTPTPVATVAEVPTIISKPIVENDASPEENSATQDDKPGFETYVVVEGDTLTSIAARFAITVDAIKRTNQIRDDAIYRDQLLIIPVEQANNPNSSSSSEQLSNETQKPALPPSEPDTELLPTQQKLSVLEGDLASAYPLRVERERFTLHYALETIPAEHPELLADIMQRSLEHHERFTGITLPFHFHAYAAGTPFLPPDQSLRGHSYSAQQYFVFLDDGSGNLDDLTYLIAHEMTHMFVWNVYGRPFDPMLSEGIAVVMGIDIIPQAKHMHYTTFCSAYSQVNALPWVSQSLSYRGHIRDLENYYAAGCFVKYLVDTYGMEMFGLLYPSDDFTADYLNVYGKTRAQLDEEWHIHTASNPITLPFDPNELVRLVHELEIAHTNLFDNYHGAPEQVVQHRILDQVRMALLEGRLDEVQSFFSQN